MDEYLRGGAVDGWACDRQGDVARRGAGHRWHHPWRGRRGPGAPGPCHGRKRSVNELCCGARGQARPARPLCAARAHPCSPFDCICACSAASLPFCSSDEGSAAISACRAARGVSEAAAS